MENSVCCVCQKPKATLQCGVCEESVCKNCAQFLDTEAFQLMAVVPTELKKGAYCGPCYDARIAPALEEYAENVSKAENISVFYKTQSKETRNFKRTEKPFKVMEAPDEQEVLMRLAFMAVQAGFNALIDVDIQSEKIRSGSYQTQKWSGSAIPVNYIGRR